MVLGTGAALAACGNGSSEEEVPEPSGEATKATTTDELAVGESASVAVSGETYLLWRKDEETVLAYTAVCTHQGCTVGVTKKDFKCPCHGSEYSHDDGSAVVGPATKPLARFAAEIKGTDVLIYL